ncbi:MULTISPECIES: hypothetical protein [unclassified Paenibacillus]|uniref:hypothetical protein n=1 Tax=unclassified Paenibacillus TaxID=185978 RepID=UPI001AEAF14F|nr:MULTISPECIES: hypothetical protein [unclassified Paenibacillus]MBP1156543.1 hypothetical protein [Paenibacillus sp. PvP091]MBP1172719.1 hypothetical protein [Paenibacillus sp. PvR098]MBP2439099.1 hypothetical protein [Paenibacillus sp. PvP052]
MADSEPCDDCELMADSEPCDDCELLFCVLKAKKSGYELVDGPLLETAYNPSPDT